MNLGWLGITEIKFHIHGYLCVENSRKQLFQKDQNSLEPHDLVSKALKVHPGQNSLRPNILAWVKFEFHQGLKLLPTKPPSQDVLQFVASGLKGLGRSLIFNFPLNLILLENRVYETYKEILENSQKVFLGSGSVRISTMVAGRVGYRHILAFTAIYQQRISWDTDIILTRLVRTAERVYLCIIVVEWDHLGDNVGITDLSYQLLRKDKLSELSNCMVSSLAARSLCQHCLQFFGQAFSFSSSK